MRGCEGERGVSMIEVMIGAIIGVVIIGAVLSILVHQSHLRQSNAESSLAINAVLNNLEQLRTVSQATLPTLDAKGFDVPGLNGEPGGLRALPGDPDNLPGQINVFVDQSSGGSVLYRVVATVAWTGATGRRRFVMQTLMGERK